MQTLWAFLPLAMVHDRICFSDEMRFRIRSMNVRIVCRCHADIIIVSAAYNLVSYKIRNTERAP